TRPRPPAAPQPPLRRGLSRAARLPSPRGAVGASIVLGARRGGVLLPLLTLPLITPALIFGAAAIDAAATGLPWKPDLELLGAFVAAALPLCPLAAGAGLRAATE
ncbi:heme exporter protein CcmB, partial [Acetobacter papayae]|uniref:heme exporter protein CcmB n=1 Tax=Acetobacter papayae TaxID=1076592 RepID=UPI0039EB2983